MIVVNLVSSYPAVLAGHAELDYVTLGDWFQISESAIELYGDVIVGVYREKVVSAYDITPGAHERDVAAKTVRFHGTKSERFDYLIGKRNPAAPWTRGQGRPIKYIPTDVVERGEAEVVDVPDEPTARRAVVSGYVLTVDADGIATLEMPPGGAAHVLSSISSSSV